MLVCSFRSYYLLLIALWHLHSNSSYAYEVVDPQEYILSFYKEFEYSEQKKTIPLDAEEFEDNRFIVRILFVDLEFDPEYYKVNDFADFCKTITDNYHGTLRVEVYKNYNFGGMKIDCSKVKRRKKGICTIL